jgi:hypothetical protein
MKGLIIEAIAAIIGVAVTIAAAVLKVAGE